MTFQAGSTSYGYVRTTEGLTTSAQIYTAINSAAAQYFINGVGKVHSSAGTPIATAYPESDTYLWSRIGDGAINDWGGIFTGDIAEIICYSRDLTTPEREQVEEYLADKWGITLP